LERSRNASNQELETLIDSFIAAHTASDDHCPAELMEAKHQLNDLHSSILNLANSVKALENELQQNEQKKSKANDDLKTAQQKHEDEKSAIADTKDDARKFLAQLRAEMAELRKIAQPVTTMNITARTVGLLQVPQPDSSDVDVKGAEAMMTQTKAASTALLTCMQQQVKAMPENRNQAKLLQVHEDVAVQRQEAAEKFLAGVLASKDCTANQSTLVTVGNVNSTLLAPAAIVNATYRSYHCSNVDKNYGGTIWLHCVNGVLSADSRGCIKFPNDAQCKAQKKTLEDTYVKAYVGIARLIDQEEKKISDKSSEDAAQKQFDDSADPNKQDAQDAEDQIADKTKKLQDLKNKLQDAWNAEKKLGDHVTATSQTCLALGNSTQYLADVRTAIHALEACPGFERPEFHIPLYEGALASFTLDPASPDDATIDAAMNAACVAKFGAASRAAEVSEIEGQAIERAPVTNTGIIPLVGKCPDCEGGSNADTGTSSSTGHARICWFPDKTFNLADRTNICYTGLKAVMCVSDSRGDVRKNGFATSPPAAGPSSLTTMGNSQFNGAFSVTRR